MAGCKKKVYDELSENFPVQFPDHESERVARQQRAMILQMDELINPDDETLPARWNELKYEIQTLLKPPKMSGPNSDLSRIRSNYTDTKIALQLEHLPVSDATPALEFWQYVAALKRKYKTQTGHAAQ